MNNLSPIVEETPATDENSDSDQLEEDIATQVEADEQLIDKVQVRS